MYDKCIFKKGYWTYWKPDGYITIIYGLRVQTWLKQKIWTSAKTDTQKVVMQRVKNTTKKNIAFDLDT